MKTKYLILFALLIIVFSCEKPKPIKYNYLSQEIKDYMNFKKGTYWIYRDVNTNKEDSVWVDTSYIKMECFDERRSNNSVCYEKLYVYQKSTFNDSIYIYISSENITNLYINKLEIIHLRNIFTIPYNKNLPDSDTLYKVYSFLNNNFKNVSYKNFEIYETWIAQNVGTIRLKGYPSWYGFKFPTPCDLQLVRYNIVQ